MKTHRFAARLFGVLGLLFAQALSQPARAADCPPTAQAPSGEAIAEAQRQARDRGALWTLDKDGRRSYLYGTVHLGRFEWTLPGPKLLQALRETERLAIEVDPSDPGFFPALQQAQQRAAPLALSPDEQARLDAQADAACLPRGALAALHPIMQATTYISLAGRRDGLDPAWGQEMALIQAARALQRPVLALESVELQMQVLLPTDPLQARRLLRQSLDSLERGEARTVLRRLGDAWSRGDLKAVGSPTELCQCQPSAEELAYMSRLNDGRNPELARRIAEAHDQGKPLLAAVGLLHMTGPQALPRLLREQGFRVERVRY